MFYVPHDDSTAAAVLHYFCKVSHFRPPEREQLDFLQAPLKKAF